MMFLIVTKVVVVVSLYHINTMVIVVVMVEVVVVGLELNKQHHIHHPMLKRIAVNIYYWIQNR